MAVKPTVFVPDDEDEEEVVTEVTRADVEKEHKAAAAKAREVARATMTRRSWYVQTYTADAFQRAVDDIHHATRAPKHEVVAALMEAAVAQASRVERKLMPKKPRSSQR